MLIDFSILLLHGNCIRLGSVVVYILFLFNVIFSQPTMKSTLNVLFAIDCMMTKATPIEYEMMACIQSRS